MKHTLIVLELNMFQKKFKNSLEIKILYQIFIDYKHTIFFQYFCIRFIDFMLKGKSLLDYTDLFSLNEYKKNDKIILNIFNRI